MACYNGIASVLEVAVRCPTFAENVFLAAGLLSGTNSETWGESV